MTAHRVWLTIFGAVNVVGFLFIPFQSNDGDIDGFHSSNGVEILPHYGVAQRRRRVDRLTVIPLAPLSPRFGHRCKIVIPELRFNNSGDVRSVIVAYTLSSATGNYGSSGVEVA